MKRWYKFGLVVLLFGLLFTSFGNCISLNPSSIAVSPGQTSPVSAGTCVRFTSNVSMNNVSYLNTSGELISNPSSNNELFCFGESGLIKSNSTLASMDFQLYDISLLYSGYILESAVDTNFCVSNDLCPVPSNFSQLYINEIEHESAPVINVSIPDEIGWDYSSDSGYFDLYISGYNVDSDYIEGLINIQNFKPNVEDFNNVITGLIPLIVPGLVILLFIRFVFRFIKKIF